MSSENDKAGENEQAGHSDMTGKTGMAGAAPGKGLSSVAQIEALADQLSNFADALHARVMKDLRSHPERPASDAEQTLARAMLEDEVMLRQRANGLYADAATYVVTALSTSQEQLMLLTADAGEKIRKIGRIRDGAGLVGAVLMLAGAAATGQAAPIVVAVERIGKSIKKIKAGMPNKAA